MQQHVGAGATDVGEVSLCKTCAKTKRIGLKVGRCRLRQCQACIMARDRRQIGRWRLPVTQAPSVEGVGQVAKARRMTETRQL